jgi:hypothetical protein
VDRDHQPTARHGLQADPAATGRRIGALREYMGEHVLSPEGFVCASYETCRASTRSDDRFFEGQLSHVGHHYDLTLDGKPLRVVVVGQEYGVVKGTDAPSRISLDERYWRIHDRSGLQRRYYADPTHEPRNPHQRGTTSALRVIFGKGLGTDWDEEFLQSADGERFHMFDAFALVNVLLCSNFRPTKNKGASTEIMRHNCLRHFAATMQILEPTLMVLQGKGVQGWIAPVLGMLTDRTPYLAEGQLNGGRVLVCRFSHPSAQSKTLSWGHGNAPYLHEVVEPTLREAISLL